MVYNRTIIFGFFFYILNGDNFVGRALMWNICIHRQFIILCILSAIPDSNALKRAEQGHLKEHAPSKPQCKFGLCNSDMLHTDNKKKLNRLSKFIRFECFESRSLRLVLRGGSKDHETQSGPWSAVLENWQVAVRIGWSVMVCVFGVTVMVFVMYSYFCIAARLVDLFAGQGRARGEVSQHIIAAFALLGSVAGSAGGGACIGYLARSSPCTHAAIVGAAFTLLQLKQVTLFSSSPLWFSILSVLPYIPICVWAAALGRRVALAASVGSPACPRRNSRLAPSDSPPAIPPRNPVVVAAESLAAIETAAAAAASDAAREGKAVITFRAVASWVGKGRCVTVTGAAKELGEWRIDAGLALSPDPAAGGGAWQGGVRLPAGMEVEYKYVATGPGGPPAWEQMAGNRRLVVPAVGVRQEVKDTCRFGPPA